MANITRLYLGCKKGNIKRFTLQRANMEHVTVGKEPVEICEKAICIYRYEY
jgi:hypothetical protein